MLHILPSSKLTCYWIYKQLLYIYVGYDFEANNVLVSAFVLDIVLVFPGLVCVLVFLWSQIHMLSPLFWWWDGSISSIWWCFFLGDGMDVLVR